MDRGRFSQKGKRIAGGREGTEHTGPPHVALNDYLPPTTKPPISMLGTSSSSQLWTARVTCQGGRASTILAIARWCGGGVVASSGADPREEVIDAPHVRL